MSRNLFAAAVVLAVSVLASADPPRPEAKNPAPFPYLTGGWTVTFANGVVEVCDVRTDATAVVSEPLRSSAGKAETRDGRDVLVFEDGRIERWTVVGNKRVVEHFFPADRYPNGTPVLGIAERVK